jgi:MarR family transcriptional regulator, organic hydroperoxide resistance regulator
MNKTELIKDIIQSQQQISRRIVPYTLESWQKLELPIAQFKSLLIISIQGKTNFRSLAQVLGVTPGNVTGIIDRLEEQGLVRRNPDLADRRIVWLEVTKKGSKLVSQLMEAQNLLAIKILDLMDQKELESLNQGMQGIIAALDKYLKE